MAIHIGRFSAVTTHPSKIAMLVFPSSVDVVEVVATTELVVVEDEVDGVVSAKVVESPVQNLKGTPDMPSSLDVNRRITPESACSSGCTFALVSKAILRYMLPHVMVDVDSVRKLAST